MTQFLAGWYPDPAGGPQQRWWDGSQWTVATAPAVTRYVRQPYPAQPATSTAPGFTPYGQGNELSGAYAPLPPGQQRRLRASSATPSGGSLFSRNKFTAFTVGIAAAYVLLAFVVHIAIIGILPVLMSVRAFRAKESLAPLSAAVAGLAVLIGLLLLAQ